MKENHDMSAPRTEWAVTVEMTGPEPLDDDRIDSLLNDLHPHQGAMSTLETEGWISATLTVTATSPARAIDSALKKLTAGLPDGWTPVLVEAMSSARQEAMLADPAVPALVGVAEAAEILGVSKQRASALAKSPHFPAPVQELRSGPVWRLAAVEAFAAQPRRSGRPAAEATGYARLADLAVTLRDAMVHSKDGRTVQLTDEQVAALEEVR